MIGILNRDGLPVKIASPAVSNIVLFLEHTICSLAIKVNGTTLSKNEALINIPFAISFNQS